MHAYMCTYVCMYVCMYVRPCSSFVAVHVDLSPNDVGYYGCKVCVEGERPDMYYSKETHLTVGAEEGKPHVQPVAISAWRLGRKTSRTG